MYGQGFVNNSQVTLHVWLRMFIKGSEALVKGFAFMERTLTVLDYIHLTNAPAIEAWSFNVYLRYVYEFVRSIGHDVPCTSALARIIPSRARKRCILYLAGVAVLMLYCMLIFLLIAMASHCRARASLLYLLP